MREQFPHQPQEGYEYIVVLPENAERARRQRAQRQREQRRRRREDEEERRNREIVIEVVNPNDDYDGPRNYRNMNIQVARPPGRR